MRTRCRAVALLFPLAIALILAATTPEIGPANPSLLPGQERASIQFQGSAGGHAEIAYRSNTGANAVDSLKFREWDAVAWGNETEQETTGSPIRAVRMAWSPVQATTRIVVSVSDDGNLDAYVCNPTCGVATDIGQVWSTAPATPEQRFDIAYEQSGEALLVYHKEGGNGTEDIAYRTFAGVAWQAEQYLDDNTSSSHREYTMIKLAAKKGTDRIALLGGESTSSDVNAWIWDGSRFGDHIEISAFAENPDEGQGAIAWESSTGHLVAVSVDSAAVSCTYREFSTTWSTATAFVCGGGGTPRWLSLKPNPTVSDDMVLAVGDSGLDLSTNYWNGTAWGPIVGQDQTLDYPTSRAFDYAWEPSGGRGLLVYATSPGQITYRNFTAPSAWGLPQNVGMGSGSHRWVQLRTNPFPGTTGTRILGAVLENAANDLGAISWNGSAIAMLGASSLSTDTGSSTWEHFVLEFRVKQSASSGPGTLPDNWTWFLPRTVFGIDTIYVIILVVGVGIGIGVAARVRRRRKRKRGTPDASQGPVYTEPDPMAQFQQPVSGPEPDSGLGSDDSWRVQ